MIRTLVDLDDDEKRLIGPYLTVDRPSGQEYRGFCAECEDPATSKSPSASYNFVRGEWHCMKNNCGGSIARLVRSLKKREKEGASDNVIDIKTRRKAPQQPLPSDKQISGYQEQLRASPRLLQRLQERKGLTPETIEQFRIGWDSARRRYVIPVTNRQNELVNVRLYDPSAKGDKPKMLPFAVGYGTQLFHPQGLDEGDSVVLCEGETDCMTLVQNGIPAVTHTGGAGAFQMTWVPEFRGKHVYICYDEDDSGRKGALRTARMLRDVAAGVYIVSGLNTGKTNGDVTDFFMGGGTAEQFQELLEEAQKHPFAKEDDDREVPKQGRKISLEETQNPAYTEPLEIEVIVAGKQTPPYVAPREIAANCDQSKGKQCTICPMAAYNGERKLTTKADDPRLLNFVEASVTAKNNVFRDLFGAMCSDRIEYTELSSWSLEELVVVQSLENRTEEVQTPMNRKVFNVGTYRTPINQSARIVGAQVPDPRNSRGIFHSWHLEPIKADLDKFTITDELLEELSVFQCEKGEDPLDKCKEIAADLAANVTQIYGRDMMHVAYDLVWHSVLDFWFQGKRVEKGWLECLVIGDTRTGKSEAATRLARHYEAGIVKSCEGATFAGLVGGAQQTPQGKGWMVTWGTIPLNDRRLVVLDEMSGLMTGRESKGIIEQMSSIRSSGKAQLTKIVNEETSARTRLIWISNPIDGKRLSETPGGAMEAIRRLITNPEDIARFDFALAASNSDVSPELINSVQHEEVEHVYTKEVCSKLVMWAWSRKADQIKWHKGSDDLVVQFASEMGRKYISDPPLVQVENIRMKLARLAVAFAARTFSTNGTGQHVVVKAEHVSAAVRFLDWVYGSEAMGYLRMSRRVAADREQANRNKPHVKKYLRTNEGMLSALRHVQYAESFRPRDFEEFGGLDVDARAAVSLLMDWRMLRRLSTQGGRIVFEPALIEVLKELEDEGV